MNIGNFKLRFAEDKGYKLFILSIIITILNYNKEDSIQAEIMTLVFIMMLLVISSYSKTDNENFGYRFPNYLEILEILSFMVFFLLVTYSLKALIIRNPLILIIELQLITIKIKKIIRKEDEDRRDWIRENICDKYEERKINILWKYKFLKSPKSTPPQNIDTFESINAYEKFFYMVIGCGVAEGLDPNMKTIIFISMIIILLFEEILFILDKSFNNYIYIDGICTGTIKSYYEGSSKLVVGIADFDKEIELSIKITEDQLDYFKSNYKIRVTYGMLSKKVVSVERGLYFAEQKYI